MLARALSLLLISLLLDGCPRAPVGGKAAGLVRISIVGTSDFHGRLTKLPLFAGYLQALRRARPGGVLLVDAGDAFQGTLDSDLNEGAMVLRAYRQLGYQALAIGNHEFDYGPVGPRTVPERPGDDPRGALKARAREAAGAFPFLAANLLENGKPVRWPNVRPSTLVRLRAGVRVGIVGVATMHLTQATRPANVRGLSVTPLAPAIRREATRLRRRGAQIVVVLAHAGARCESFQDPRDVSSCRKGSEVFAVARALPHGLVDAIIGGHNHGGVAHVVNGIPIASAYSKGRAFSRIDLTWDPRAQRVVRAWVRPPTRIVPRASYAGQPVEPDSAIAALARDAWAAAQRRRRESVGVTFTAPVSRAYHGESALGNLVSSLMLEVEPRAHLAITNGGGLKADLPQGTLRYGALYDAIPFENRLVLVRMTGRRLKRLFATNLTSHWGIFSIAGARVVARCRDGALEVELFLLPRRKGNGAAAAGPARRVREGERLWVLTHDFLATGGDGFPVGDEVEVLRERPFLREAVIDRLRARTSPIDPRRWYSASRPRLELPGPLPLKCGVRSSGVNGKLVTNDPVAAP